ncbi:hypothetical protein BS17DRAFT_769262 [Gyrodon lividus]|nr:hypothetical protein BS17DRAFT_769262 [Gyrodon lividus]
MLWNTVGSARQCTNAGRLVVGILQSDRQVVGAVVKPPDENCPALQEPQGQLNLATYLEILQAAIEEAEASDSDSRDSPESPSDFGSSDNFNFNTPAVINFHNAITALYDEVEKTWVLNNWPPPGHAPQLHLLDEWKINHPNLFQTEGHYGNAATSQVMGEWTGVSVGTVHNCYK